MTDRYESVADEYDELLRSHDLEQRNRTARFALCNEMTNAQLRSLTTDLTSDALVREARIVPPGQ